MSTRPVELHDKQLRQGGEGNSHELSEYEDDAEEAYWADLAVSGLINGPPIRATNVLHFDPVVIDGDPVSETIINNRR
jgi:hypothetical protein